MRIVVRGKIKCMTVKLKCEKRNRGLPQKKHKSCGGKEKVEGRNKKVQIVPKGKIKCMREEIQNESGK